MDTFFSLFDPADGIQYKKNNKKQRTEQDSVKKKNDTPKGRRRGRRANGKNETLPEESSFLCEPELSTELLVKDVSYIENYIEINRRDDDNGDEKRNKRRHSGRKSRRRKTKISPLKELSNQGSCGADNDVITNGQRSLNNNYRVKPKVCDSTVGKNVNDLSNDFKKTKRKDPGEYYEDRTVYNVIDKLEKVNLKDDMYLSGDFNTVDFANEVFYSSDDGDDFVDDSLSDLDDSAEEAFGSLPPEPRFGNVEYKLQLVSLCERRFQHLVTQLKWRLRSGGGSCVYVVGVRDCGALVGLRPRQLRGSLCALRGMARALSATLTHVTARRVAPHRAVAEVYIRKLADPQQSVELRVAVMGANEAGKSTLIGVLTQGELDNGRGSARLNMFRHLHEVKSGRTSSLSHEILGFDAQGNVVNYGCSELMTAERIGERSAKLVSFLDLAGHTKYQRTTLHGLTGYSPHYGMLLISATAGISKITEEHISLLLALDMQFFIVITKCELAPGAVQPLVTRLAGLLEPANKKPLLIKDENHARNSVAPQKLILDTIEQDREMKADEVVMDEVPVFPVSCVRGVGLSSLHAYLLAVQPPLEAVQHQPEDEKCEFQIDEIFHMGDSSGPVVGGLLAKGRLHEGDDLIMGPLDDGSFVEVRVRSVYRNRVPVRGARAGQCCSLGFASGAPALRPGMVLLALPVRRQDSPTACRPAVCATRLRTVENSVKPAPAVDEMPKERVNFKNLLHDIALAEEGLAKNMENIDRNVYSGESESELEEECLCDDKVYLDDPNDPRGCIYFQASVHLQRHSTAIYPGFQCTVHVGNVRQTAIIEGILSNNSVLRAGQRAACVFRFVRCPEYLVTGRRLLFTAGLGTRAIGRVTQIFPYIP